MSLNLRVGNELDAELGDLLEDEGTTPEEFAAREGLRQDIEQVIDQHLSRLQRQVLILRYGFGGEEPMTLKEIGKRLGMGRDRVSQIERDALAKLRQSQPEMKAYLAS
jgi:RNA polymerase nonessential primary-like sigma factor